MLRASRPDAVYGDAVAKANHFRRLGVGGGVGSGAGGGDGADGSVGAGAGGGRAGSSDISGAPGNGGSLRAESINGESRRREETSIQRGRKVIIEAQVVEARREETARRKAKRVLQADE